MSKPAYPRLPNIHNAARQWYTANGSGTVFDGRLRTLTTNVYASTKTPGWKAMARWERRRINNPYSNFADYMHYHPGSALFRTWGPTVGMTGYFFTGVPPVSITLATTDAGAKALSKVQNRIARFKVNLSQTMAERRQAVNMMTKRINQLIVLARAVKRGDYQNAVRDIMLFTGLRPPPGRKTWRKTSSGMAGDFADNWLEVQYGWRPLLSDIYGSAEVIADTYHRKYPTVFSAVATAERSIQGVTGSSVYEMSFNMNWVGTVSETVRYVIELVEDDTLGTALASTGISNPALLAWELVPYSFVVDWFVPVGNYLEQLEYARGLRFIRGTVSSRGTRGAIGTASRIYQPGLTVQNLDLRADYRSEWKSRNALASFPYAGLPSFEPNLGVERALNGIALLTQLFTGRKVWKH